jgi:hypothetical protein
MKGLYGGVVTKKRDKVLLRFRDGSLGQVKGSALAKLLESSKSGSIDESVGLAFVGQGIVRLYIPNEPQSTIVIEIDKLRQELAKAQ